MPSSGKVAEAVEVETGAAKEAAVVVDEEVDKTLRGKKVAHGLQVVHLAPQ
jgi:hypothetical protein